MPRLKFAFVLILLAVAASIVLNCARPNHAQQLPQVENVELQPLTAQVRRLIEATDYLGAPFSAADKKALERAGGLTDAARARREIQDVLDRYCLFDIHINPESRVKVAQGAAKPELTESGWRTFLVKVRNEAGVTAQLKALSLNAQKVFSRGKGGFSSSPRPDQTITERDVRDRWLDLAMFDKPPMKPQLSGLELEYRIIQLYSRDVGRREARIGFNVGQGSQDIGFRNEADVLFNCLPAADVTFRVQDERGRPATASFIIRDAQGHIYPLQTKRLAPDFDFHPQIYRTDGERLKLPAGDYTVEFTRGPEYLVKRQPMKILAGKPQSFTFKLERWIELAKLGWYSGDHHIHAAGCMHYETPSQGVKPEDMIRHILGEDLNVGSVLTWGPCYYYQKQFFEAKDNRLSTSENLMRYDVEVSGFPSSHAGHLVLLRLKDQDYPGAKVLEDWPTWDLPVLQWAKAQGAVVGFAHSGWGLEMKSNELPSYELPKFDGIGANEYIVDVTHDAVDFISTVDTPAPWELNIWYHTLNAGFRTRISGETDFPCIYGERVGLGRSYVRLDGKLTYDAWVAGIDEGRAYVTDGKSHLLDFQVNGVAMGVGGSELKLDKPATVRVTAKVAARLDEQPNEAIRKLRADEKLYWELERARIGTSREVPVELIVNGRAVAKQTIVADGHLQDLKFEIPIEQSSWVALRVLPSSHTNPVFVLVDNQPIRASRRSVEWCLKAVDQCWSQKAPKISAKERPDAEKAYQHAREVYRRILAESKTD
ncbi:MAG TPA: CehA/McbA family metallohydrolase [Blastocatellia bacterium]|nr:CehA/McbA family metallohydrolase [Blastocatellia bacterium]HMX26326.1 CehA/McbA family metallohydrolase [Blastocatellia bacterium]HMZ18756.1 CehA/McbA family metallohydrolase [Blastocatellia bacterium]